MRFFLLPALAGLLLIMGSLIGCGQKGPLYIPKDDANQETRSVFASETIALQRTDHFLD